MTAPFARRLQLVTGKGGTGKTTLVAALGLAHAARGKKPLLVELGHRASLAAHFGRETTLGHDATEVRARVSALNVDTDRAMRELVLRALPRRSARFGRYALSAGPVRAFLGAAPAALEVATLDRIRHFVDETDFDPILVDGDATGHAHMLLGVSGVLTGLGASGPIGALTERFAAVFADPSVAAVHLVALPTALAVEETLALRRSLEAGGRVALGHTILNRVEGTAARGLDLERVARVEAAMERVDGVIASEVALLRVDGERALRADAMAAKLASGGARALETHERGPEELDVAGLEALGAALLAEAERA